MKELNSKLPKLNALLEYLENNYSDEIKEDKEFVDCTSREERFQRSICADEIMLKQMKKLNVNRIRFEVEQGKLVVFFWRTKTRFNLSMIYYKYEYGGTSYEFRSHTIYYKPVDEHWSLYVDSSFP